jgi:CRISPR-associated protein Cas8b/Csh1 subtype I-B
LDPDTLRTYLPDDTISSLREVQALYGAMSEAATDFIGGDPEYAIYYTPGELDEFVSDDENPDRLLVQVVVDLTDADPEFVRIDTQRLTPELVERLGYSRYPWGRGIDHSITNRGAKGGSDPSTITRYCLECLGRWTNADGREPAVGKVADEHPDGWIIEALQRLSDGDDIESRIESEVLADVSKEDTPRVVATVRLRLDPSKLTEGPDDSVGEYLPGEVDVLNAGMRARKDDKLSTKQTDEPSRGSASCMVRNEEREVFGTAEDPLAFFTVQHAEKFPQFKRTEAWRAHPISSEAALLLQSGSSLLDECRRVRNGRGVYTLPYFTSMERDYAGPLYRAICDLDGDEDAPLAVLQRLIEEYDEDNGTDIAESLRFYVIGVRNDSGDINVLEEVPDASIYWPRVLATDYIDVLRGSSFGLAAGFRREDNWQLLTSTTREPDVVDAVTSGWFARSTLPTADDAVTDDLTEWMTYSLLVGDSLPVERLLEGFVERIEGEYDSEDGNRRFPENHVKTQFAQLEALAAADLLHVRTGDRTELTTPPTFMQQTNSNEQVEGDSPPVQQVTSGDGLTLSDALRYRLNRFVDERAMLSENDQRRGTFLMGVLVGQLSDHQSNERGMNRTLMDEHPADRVTADRLARVFPKLVQRSRTYAAEVDWAGTVLFPETLDALDEVKDATPPSEWTLPAQDLRYFYSLGLAYGLRARARAYDLVESLRSDAADHGIEVLVGSSGDDAQASE